MADIVEGDLSFFILDESFSVVEAATVGPLYFLAFRCDSSPSPVLTAVTATLTQLAGFAVAVA